MQYHKPVLLKEVLDGLNIKKDGLYIDCTLGDGGHTLEILRLGGSVLGIDYSEDSLARATERIKEEKLHNRFLAVKGNFKNINKLIENTAFTKVNGILFDFGYSSYQLDDGGFGLSFQRDEPLDMRIDKTKGVSAADLVNSLNESQLSRLFFEYGGEQLSNKFARAIVRNRNLKKIQTTKELADILVSEASLGYEKGRIHPATRVFQALRILINDEIDNIAEALPRAAQLLLPGGRMVIISFHSLEDKIAKNLVKDVRLEIKAVNKKPIVPEEQEVISNIRSRSAKLRIYEKN